MKTNPSLTAAVAVLLVGLLSTTVFAETTSDESASLAASRKQIEKDRLYPRMDCLQFVPEDKDVETISFAVREIHSETCGGDPDTAPVVDRYRVNRRTNELEWYDVLNDEFLPYAEALKAKKPN